MVDLRRAAINVTPSRLRVLRDLRADDVAVADQAKTGAMKLGSWSEIRRCLSGTGAYGLRLCGAIRTCGVSNTAVSESTMCATVRCNDARHVTASETTHNDPSAEMLPTSSKQHVFEVDQRYSSTLRRALLKMMGALGGALRRTPLVRWRWLGRVYDRLAVSVGRTDSITVGQFRVYVDPRDQVIAKKLFLYGAFEEREIELLCSFVRPGDCVLDVGANIGLYSLALSRAVGPHGRVIAVEPDPDNLALLRRNLLSNECVNVTVVEEALGDTDRTVHLYGTRENSGGLSTADILGVGPHGAIPVPMRRGDSVLGEMGVVPRVAKIDVEGAEPLVLAGLGDRLPQVLLFEFVPWQLRAAGHDPVTFLHHLTSLGYRLAIVDPESGRQQTMSEEQIHACIAAARTDRNILALR